MDRKEGRKGKGRAARGKDIAYLRSGINTVVNRGLERREERRDTTELERERDRFVVVPVVPRGICSGEYEGDGRKRRSKALLKAGNAGLSRHGPHYGTLPVTAAYKKKERSRQRCHACLHDLFSR